MKIKVQYYAVFREQRGLSSEEVSTHASNALDLYEELKSQYNFSLDNSLVKLSLNQHFQPMESCLNEGDEVVFIPPVAGG